MHISRVCCTYVVIIEVNANVWYISRFIRLLLPLAPMYDYVRDYHERMLSIQLLTEQSELIQRQSGEYRII